MIPVLTWEGRKGKAAERYYTCGTASVHVAPLAVLRAHACMLAG